MITRRKFLGASIIGGAALSVSPSISSVLASARSMSAFTAPLLQPDKDETLITILHTNDQHSQIDPLPANDRNAGKGGVARRATLVKRLRAENPNTLLLDAGDAFQGTPYFNFYKGEAAMKFAKFEFVSANYDVRGTAIESRVKPYVVRELGGIRIGIFGLGISPTGLITPEDFQGIKYYDPVKVSHGAVRVLREKERCAMVVCASHLGYYPNPKGDEIGDSQLVAQVDGIDFIASGHTHTFMKEPVIAKQPSGGNTVIFQVGKSGIYLGRVDFTVRANKITAYAGRLLDLRDA
jgi:5'-nucleotidase